jgi:plastocyanin
VLRMRWAGVVVAGALALAGCGGGDEAGSASGASSSGSGGAGGYGDGGGSGGGGGGKLALAADPGGGLSFDKTTLNAKAGKLTIAFENTSSVPHAVEIEGNGVEEKSKVVTGGATTVTADLDPGTYVFYCPVGQHRQNGMEGKLVVK